MPYRIVVFNHSPNILLLIESVLKKKGFEVFTFLETLTDVSRVTDLAPDLVIIGYIRGYESGEMEIIQHFRADSKTAHVPIIVCTTGAAHIRENGSLDGVSYIAIVPKPFNVQELVDSVYRALKIETSPQKIAPDGAAITDTSTSI